MTSDLKGGRARVASRWSQVVSSVGLLVLASACGTAEGRIDSADGALSVAALRDRDTSLAELPPVHYRLTEGGLTRWLRAARALDSVPVPVRVREPAADWEVDAVGLHPLDRLASRLTERRDARKAIEGAGISVRDFVLMTAAVQQAITARSRGELGAGTLGQNVAFLESHLGEVEGALSGVGLTGVGVPSRRSAEQDSDRPNRVDDLQSDDRDSEIRDDDSDSGDRGKGKKRGHGKGKAKGHGKH